jgi:hypothetical protein
MTKISIILGVSVALMLFIFLLVGHHRDIPDRVRQAADSQREPVTKAAGAPAPSRP